MYYVNCLDKYIYIYCAIHELEKQIPAIEKYRKYKVYYKNYTSLEGKSKKKYGENSRYELDQYHECRKKLKELFPNGIIPKIKDLQDELKKAREEYAKMSAERKPLKKEADRLSRLAQQKRDSQRTLARYRRVREYEAEHGIAELTSA